MTLSRLVARPLLSSVFFLGGYNALRNADKIAPKAAPVTQRLVPLVKKVAPSVPITDDPTTLVRLNAVVQIGAALAFATGRAPRLSATLLATSLVPTTIAGHAFWSESEPEQRKAQMLQFVKNASVLGGLLIAAGDTEGKPGVAWRAGRGAKDARREASHLATTARREAKHYAKAARREAKLAKAQLT